MRFLSRCRASVWLLLLATDVWAGGFQVWEQDASGIGDYHSSAAAEAINPGTQFYNPAGMTNLSGPALSGGLTYIPLTIQYSGTAGPEQAYTTATSFTNNFIPNLFFVYPFWKHYAFGFGVTTPFGSSTDYPADNPIADAATTTSLQMVNFNPSFAYAPSKYVSFAAGVDALYAIADYNSAFYSFATPPAAPVSLENDLTAWAYGWNAGLLLYPTNYLRLGLSYRSEMQLDGHGSSKYKDPEDPMTSDTLSGVIKLPPTWIVGLYADVNPRWSLLFSAFYTQWEVFDQLVLHNVQVLYDSRVLSIYENYDNSWNLALGAHYWIFENFLMLKMGVGYDQSPTVTGYRDVRLPDAPKYSMALGLHFDASRSVVVDVGWTHFFVIDATVDNRSAMTDADDVAQFTTTVGTSKTQVNVLGLQVTWKI